MNDPYAALTDLAREARQELVAMVGGLGVGHLGGSLSIIEALIWLYFREMNIRPDEQDWLNRDRLVLSKGHAGPALYAVLAIRGYFGRELLSTLNRSGTLLPSHCDRTLTPGVDMTAGSLGQGLSAAAGFALAARLEKNCCRAFCILGDGELQEGQVWEAAMFAAAQKLDNLVVLVDDNGMQLDGMTEDINPVRPIENRWAAFGWEATLVNGHDFAHLEKAFLLARTTRGRPTAIILRTVKGKGISMAENKVSSHNMALSPEETAEALSELRADTGARHG